MPELSETFGCTHCFVGDPATCWQSRPDHQLVRDLVEESHFIVRIVACKHCGQQFVSIFCERIDWAGGEDPQYSILFPINAAEAMELADGGLDEDKLRRIGDGRPKLCMHWPSEAARQVRKFDGGPLIIPPHD
jgi:hypothetical protein